MTTSDDTAGPFCHDHYEHPLLWCDEKKRLVERKNAEESLRMWRRRKTEEFARKERDKQEYFELTVKHCPWGRPGGGAPNVDVRRKDITAVGLHSTPSIATAHRLSSLQPCRYSDYFSQQKKCHETPGLPSRAIENNPYHSHNLHHHHHHRHLQHTHAGPRVTHAHTVHHHLSPTRPTLGSTVTICERDIDLAGAQGVTTTKNGERVEITVREHPSMSFRNKGHVDVEVRYKPTAAAIGRGKPLLEKVIVTETDKCPIVDGAGTLSGGGGGAHLPGSVAPPLMGGKSMSPLKHKPKPLPPPLAKCHEKPSSKGPWGKVGPGGKPWRSPKAAGSSFMKSLGWTNKDMLKELDQDNPVTPAEKNTFRKPPRAGRKPQRCCDVCICTCPALTSPLKPLPKTKPPPPCGGGNHSLPPKPKGDAPKAKICPRLTRRCTLAIPSAEVGVGTQPSAATAATDCSAAAAAGGGVELVPLLARRRAAHMARPVSLSSTDVTKRTASNDRLGTSVDLRYLHDLNTQMSEKRQTISVSQQVDRELSQQHFETFDTYWGRPGHGAPRYIKNKLKLDNLLYGSQGCTSE